MFVRDRVSASTRTRLPVQHTIELERGNAIAGATRYRLGETGMGRVRVTC